jgi:hypothetical protein
MNVRYYSLKMNFVVKACSYVTVYSDDDGDGI